MSTADKLNKLLETKQAIKQAIIDKGVDVSDNTVFAEYPAKINAIEGANDIDLSNYVTKDELPPIRVIGNDNPDEPYVLTGNEFTDEEYENYVHLEVIFRNVVIGSFPELYTLYNGLVHVSLCYWDRYDDGVMWKDIYISSAYNGERDFVVHPETGVIEEDWGSYFAYYEDLEDYATKEYVDNAIRNIEIPEVDLENYATKEELNDAISNIEISGGSGCALKVIGDINSEEPHMFTGDEFTDEEIENQYIPVLFRNVEIAGLDISGLCDVRFLGRDLIYIYSPRLGFHEYFKDGDTGEWYESTGYYYATDFELEGVREELAGYATKKELNNALGDIESLLGNI